MSKISTTYDAIITKCTALFPFKIRLHNPYSLLQNPEIVRKDSWGVSVNDANREETEFCNVSIVRSFTFKTIRQYVSLAGKEDGFDSVSKSILEDQQSFINAFFSPDQIGQGDSIERIDFSEISGIQFLEDNEKKYLFSEVTFNILISEAII
jgi:hypothetical protein